MRDLKKNKFKNANNKIGRKAKRNKKELSFSHGRLKYFRWSIYTIFPLTLKIRFLAFRNKNWFFRTKEFDSIISIDFYFKNITNYRKQFYLNRFHGKFLCSIIPNKYELNNVFLLVINFKLHPIHPCLQSSLMMQH